MKETILEALMQLFTEIDIHDLDAYPELLATLEKAGYQLRDIQKTAAWLQSFAEVAEHKIQVTPSQPTIRIYSPDEKIRLGIKGQNFLHYLENIQVIDSKIRELIIDRLLMLENKELTIAQIRWITLMVLANRNQKVPPLSWLDCIVTHPKSETSTCH